MGMVNLSIAGLALQKEHIGFLFKEHFIYRKVPDHVTL